MKETKGFDCPKCEKCTRIQDEATHNECTSMVYFYYRAILKRILGEPDLANQLLDFGMVIAKKLNCAPAREKFEF